LPRSSGEVSTEEFFGLEASSKEMHVVNERVGNVCGAKSGGKLGLPNPLGEPRAGRQPAEVLLEIRRRGA